MSNNTTSYVCYAVDSSRVTAINNLNTTLPSGYSLEQNYPNPFNPITKINYELPVTNYADLSIYNLLGQKVATLVDKKQAAGRYQVQWDASGFASGIYIYQLKAKSKKQKAILTRKLLLIK
jgi:hypothetical protein